MWTYEIVNKYLHAEEVERLFTLGSSGFIDMLSEIQEEGDIRVVHSRHEQMAISMADGYSRFSGDIGVCLIGCGPAIAQTGTALTTARKNGSKLLVIVPTTSISYSDTYTINRFERFAAKSFDQHSFLESTIGTVIPTRSRDAVLPNLREAFRTIRVGEGPVAVQIPVNVLNSRTDDPGDVGQSAPVAADSYGSAGARLHPDEERIREAVDLYLDSNATEVPVVLVGLGAVKSDAREAIENLAERTNAVLATTINAKGYFFEHPFSIGITGQLESSLAGELLNRTDYVVAVGCTLNPRTTDSNRLFGERAKVVHVDRDPASIEHSQPVTLGITGDVRTTVESLTAELERRQIDRTDEFWTGTLRERIIESSPLNEGRADAHPGENDLRPGGVDPRDLVASLDRTLPENRVVVVDGGHSSGFAIDGMTITDPSRFIWPKELSSVGLALPTGIGVALGMERGTCIVFCGDGGFMMSMQELDTAVRCACPIIVVVMNDGALGAEYHALSKSSKYADVSLVDAPDLATVATAMGADGYGVSSITELEDLSSRLDHRPAGPIVVDCQVDPRVTHRTIEGHMQ